MKIALIANNIHFRGGMERYCAELATALCETHEVHLFATEVADVPLDKLTVHPVKTVSRPILALFVQFYLNSSRQIRLRDYDVVHTVGGISAQQNFVTAQYCQYAWGDAIQREPGAGAGITAYHRFMWRLTGYFERRAMTSSQTLGISANSCQTSLDLQKFYGADPAKIRVIPNAVDANRFTPVSRRFRRQIRRRYGISEAATVILFVGEYRRKGLATVIRALGRLKDPQVHLLAVGKGSRQEYGRMAEEAGVASRVILAGPTKDIENVFGAVDLFVFPTFYEPFGMVITEAMASGLPVITSRRAGAAEMIEDGKSGLLLDQPGDADELVGKIQSLMGNQLRREEMGALARRAASIYTWGHVAEETLRLYQDGLSRSPTALMGS